MDPAAAPVIDGDGHLMEPLDLWSARMDAKKWGDWFPHFSPEDQAYYVGGVARIGGPGMDEAVAAINGVSVEEYWRRTPARCRPPT